jgi:hypothetical protein
VRIPYANTTIPAERTKADIETLLKEHGIKDIAWMTFKGESKLQFIYYLEIRGVEKQLIFEFRPPQILVTKRQFNPKLNRYEKMTFNNEPVAFRLLYWYLSSKLNAVKYGIVTIEREFITQISLALAEGTITLGERLMKALETGKLEQLALPEKTEREAIEVEAKEVKEEREP